MQKEYIVELREEEADELMDEHWVGELVRCKDCKHRFNGCCYGKKSNRINFGINVSDDWYCADGERKDDDA